MRTHANACGRVHACEYARAHVRIRACIQVGALPSVADFEASFYVLAPHLKLDHAEPLAALEPAVLDGGLPYPRFNIEPRSGDVGRHDSEAEATSHAAYSLSFGDLHAPIPTGAGGQAFGGGGAGRGLRVQFALSTSHMVPLILGRCNSSHISPPCQRRIVRSDVIRVLYDRQLLASASVGRNLSCNCWSKVVVRTSDARLSVSHNGVEYLSDVQLPLWGLQVGSSQVESSGATSRQAPQPHWLFGLGAEVRSTAAPLEGEETEAGTRSVIVDDWRLSSGHLPASHSAPLRLSFNGQQYSQPLPFAFYRPPTLSAASPSSGPISGGTSVMLHGESLAAGTAQLCAFPGGGGRGHTTEANVSARGCGGLSPACAYLACWSPAANASRSALRVTLNGQQFHSSTVRFTYHQPAAVSSVHPRGGSTDASPGAHAHPHPHRQPPPPPTTLTHHPQPSPAPSRSPSALALALGPRPSPSPSPRWAH